MIGDFFLDLVAKIKPPCPFPNVVEIGVKEGRTSKNLLSKPWVKLWMIDPWKPLNDYERWTQEQCDEQYEKALEVTRFAMDRRVILRMTSKSALKETLSPIHLVILDANHSYDHVEYDIENWMKKLAPNGIMCGRFYGKIDGVTNAVNEYCKKEKLTLHLNGKHGWWFGDKYND